MVFSGRIDTTLNRTEVKNSVTVFGDLQNAQLWQWLVEGCRKPMLGVGWECGQ